MKESIKSFFGLVFVIALFILISYAVQDDLFNLEEYIGDGYFGAFIYVLIAIITTVFAPLSSVPLLPVVSNIYGWFLAGLLSIVGWTIGSVVAFLLARKYGIPLVKKVVSLEKISSFEQRIPRKNLFWSIVFLRIIIPVDILSYVLGLFSRIKFWTYFWATLIGVAPFAFLIAYVGGLNVFYQLSFFVTGALGLILVYLIFSRRKGN